MSDKDKIVHPTPEFYANGLQLAASPFDVTITFGLQNPSSADSGEITKIDVLSEFIPTARVRMSPQLIVVVARVLSRVVDDWEKENGKIPISAELLKKFGLSN